MRCTMVREATLVVVCRLELEYQCQNQQNRNRILKVLLNLRLLLGASGYLPNVVWFELFLKHQGIELKLSRFNQDNQSAIKLEINGKRLCGPGSRNIYIRYFFVKTGWTLKIL